MVAHIHTPCLVLLMQCFFLPINGRSVAIKVPIIHRDSPASPLFDFPATELRRFRTAMKRSLKRAESIYPTSTNSSNGARNHNKSDTYYVPVTAASEGDYVTTLSLGTPPQKFSAVFVDTGSTLVWLKCSNASTTARHFNGSMFNRAASRTFRTLSCRSPVCRAVQKDVGVMCRRQRGPQDMENSTADADCRFQYTYVDLSGSSGVMATETLSLPKVGGRRGTAKFKNFAFGCSTRTVGIQGDGGLGLDRGSYSFLSQLEPALAYKFSYCLSSTNSNASSTMYFGKQSGPRKRTPGLMWTPLLSPNNTGRHAYYVDVKGIGLGGRRLPVPSSVFSVKDGGGGTVMDAGTTFTLLTSEAYRVLMLGLILTVPYPQVFLTPALEAVPCYNISDAGSSPPDLPGIEFYFSGGATLEIPWENLFFPVQENVVCMAVQESPEAVSDLSIIGNRSQQNFHFFFDLKKNVVGFVRKSCSHAR